MKETELSKQISYKDKFNRLFRRGDTILYKTNKVDYKLLTTECEALMVKGKAVVYFEELKGLHSVEPIFYKTK